MTNDKRRKLIQSLFSAPVRRCRTFLHVCVLCGKTIKFGEHYADRGHPRRAHHSCVQYAAASEGVG